MDRVKSQAAVVSQLLFDPKTADAYKSVLVLTGRIIKEVALLAWLLICSVFVFVAWFGDIATKAGGDARQWWQAQQTRTATGNQTAAATGKALLDVSQNGANFLLDKAREQLGLEQLERPVTESTPTAEPTPVKASPAPTITMQVQSKHADQPVASPGEAAPSAKGATLDEDEASEQPPLTQRS
ncbi:MAG: hypothetical protein AAGI45_11115 [Cyanobacteria bacterium P01_H01_bin.26]